MTDGGKLKADIEFVEKRRLKPRGAADAAVLNAMAMGFSLKPS